MEGPEVFESAVPTPCCDLGHMDFLPKKELAFFWLGSNVQAAIHCSKWPQFLPFYWFHIYFSLCLHMFCKRGPIREWSGCSLHKDLAFCVSNLADGKARYVAPRYKPFPGPPLGCQGFARNWFWPCLTQGQAYYGFRSGASLVAQWLRIHLPMRGAWVWSLAWEDSTRHGAAKPMRHSYWDCALTPGSRSYWATLRARALQEGSEEPTHHNERKLAHSKEDPVQQKKKKKHTVLGVFIQGFGQDSSQERQRD